MSSATIERKSLSYGRSEGLFYLSAQAGSASSTSGRCSPKPCASDKQDRADVAKARAEWREKQSSWSPSKLVFIDETWTKTNMTRLYGRAPCGKRLVEAVPHGHWKTSTVIGALRCDGLTATGVFDGPVNDD